MRWRGRRQSTNVEDRRGGPTAGPGTGFGRRGGFRIPTGGMRSRGGGGLSGIVILVVLFFVLRAVGIDPLAMLAENRSQPGGGQITTSQPPANDEMTQFVRTILAETEDVWNGIFESEGLSYSEPTLVLFGGQVSSACGFASSAAGPFYCPGDRRIYLDTEFFDLLARRFNASGDFAAAYVIAHEVGHHIQNLTGILPKFNQMRRSMSQAEANAMSVRVELQADCFAGVWGHFTAQKGLLEEGDIEDALNAATQIGDDTIQKRTQGFVVPESFSHGNSEQRRTWFARGMESGRLADCDTFSGSL